MTCAHVFVALVAALLASAADASLLDRGNGLIYDSDLDITWLANANLPDSNSFGVSGIAANGTMAWATADAYVAAANSASYLGFSDWRLPTSLQPDPGCSVQNSNGSTGTGCSGSELGHLFYLELGGTAGSSVLGSGDPDLALFQNLIAGTTQDRYWTSTQIAVGVYYFELRTGQQSIAGATAPSFVWLVRDGDSLPEPVAAALLAVGLGGLAFAGRKRLSRR